MTYPLFNCRDKLEQLKAEAAAVRGRGWRGSFDIMEVAK